MRVWREKNPRKKYDRTYQERLAYHREYNRKNAKHLSERKHQYYLNNKELFRKLAIRNYQKNKEKIAERARILREEVLMKYGKRCGCCGETYIQFLAIDHKNNDGARHRAEIKQKMYTWAKKNNYPDILQILCHNCNLAKAFYGKCPHKEKKGTS